MGYSCGRGGFPAFWACSAHLTSLNDGVATSQAYEYRNAVNFLRLLQPASTAAGDFNLVPAQDTAFEHLTAFKEANCLYALGQCPTWEPQNIKIDYVYSTMCRTRNGSLFSLPRSDHHVLRGFFGGC